MPRKLLTVLLVFALTLSIAACGTSAPPVTTAAATTAAPAATTAAAAEATTAAATEAATTAAATTAAATTQAAIAATAPPAPVEMPKEQIEGADPNAIITIFYNNDFSNLDPALTSDGQGGVLGFMMPPLMDVHPDYSLSPGIAESYTVNDASTVFTFKIPDGIMFHDDTPCDAFAVKWNYDRQVGGNATPEMPYAQTIFGNVSSVEAPDKNTLVISLYEPDGTLPVYLAMANGTGLVSPTAWQADPEGFRRNPVGAGPYIFEEWVSDQYIKMRANPNYFRGQVQNAGAVIRVIKDNSVAVSEFITGGLDFMALASTDVPLVERAGYDVFTRPAAGFSYFVFADYKNNPFFNDINVRKAIAHAMNMEAMVQGVYQGRNEVATSYIPPIMVGGEHSPFDVPEYNPVLAEELLDAAGYPKDENGVRFSFSYICRNEAWNTQMGVAIQMELDKIGVKVNVMPLPRPEWLNKGVMEVPDYDTVGRNWGAATNDTSYMAMLFTADNAIPGGLNISKWISEEFTSLVSEARRTGDLVKQGELYAQSARIMNEELPVIFLEQHATLWVQQPYLIDPDGNVGWNGVNYWWKIGKPAGK